MELYHSILTLYIIIPRESGSRCTGIVLKTSVVVPAGPKSYHLKGIILLHFEDDFILFRIFVYSVPLLLNC